MTLHNRQQAIAEAAALMGSAGGSKKTPAQTAARRRSVSELESRDEVLPSSQTKTIKDRIEEIEDKLKSGSAPSIDDLLHEKTELKKYLAGGRVKLPYADRSYRPAVFPGESKKARDAVRKAIKQATDKMTADKALASLAAHLDASIRYGNTVSYSGSIAWTVEAGVFPRKKS